MSPIIPTPKCECPSWTNTSSPILVAPPPVTHSTLQVYIQDILRHKCTHLDHKLKPPHSLVSSGVIPFGASLPPTASVGLVTNISFSFQLCLVTVYHGMFQMWWLNSGFLILEHVLSRRCSYEAEKRRGGVQRAHAEFWVSLQTGKVGVVWAYASVFRVKENIRHETIHELFSSDTCICSSFPSLPTKYSPLCCSLSTYAGFTSYRCRCRSHILPAPPYSARAFDQVSLPSSSTVGLSPRRIVSPICVRGISDIKMTTGCFALASNSPDMAPSKLSTFSLILPRQAGTRGRCLKTGFWTRARTLWRASCLLIRAGRTRPGQEFRKPPPTSS